MALKLDFDRSLFYFVMSLSDVNFSFAKVILIEYGKLIFECFISHVPNKSVCDCLLLQSNIARMRVEVC